MSSKKRIIKNGVSNTVAKFVRISEQLLLVPFFITAWGAAYYGEWLTLTIIPTILSFSDLGFGSSAANKFVLQYASGDKQGAANTAKTGILIISLSIVAGIFISLATLFTADYFHIFNKSLIERKDAILSISLLMVSQIITFYHPFYEAFYKSARKAALSTNLGTAYSSLNIITSFLVLYTRHGVIAFALANLCVSVLFNIYYIYKGYKILELRSEYKGVIIKSEFREIASNGLGYLLSPIWQALYFQGTTFVVRLTLGPLAVTIYNTIRTVTRSVNQVFSLIIISTFPEFQIEIGKGNLEKARKIFRMTFVFVIIAAIVGIVFLYFFGSWFYQIWTNKALNPPKAMWNIFILGIAFNSIWWTAIITFQAYNKPYAFTLAGTIAAIISLIVTYFFCKYFGLVGAAIGSFSLDFLLAFYVLPKSCKMLGQPINELFKDLSQVKYFSK